MSRVQALSLIRKSIGWTGVCPIPGSRFTYPRLGARQSQRCSGPLPPTGDNYPAYLTAQPYGLVLAFSTGLPALIAVNAAVT